MQNIEDFKSKMKFNIICMLNYGKFPLIHFELAPHFVQEKNVQMLFVF